MKKLLHLFHAAGWVAYFSLLGFIAGVAFGAAWVGNQREEAGYRKAEQELIQTLDSLKSH